MLRTLFQVRRRLAAGVVGVGLLCLFPADAPASADRPRTRVWGLDRSRKLTAWERGALDRALPGRTLPDVIRRLGQPDQELSLGRGHLRLTYWLGRDGNLRITLRDGRVSDVAHDAWQTGVREDDLVGSVGP